ncbi:MAG: acetyl-CoA carboxylase, carboxyltransferase subunit beta [Sphingomonadaceae bacterium]|uniref:acetyl-CoA carboxylase, carboxyltransferase subunit beta n=1 Tax=Thermaurantiacus sp. TaxID=2820283 RepID=UPI00298F3874|nr:acetyl-CoA carboxylase, carboxyltransferase subunit beta [Thermaurantiacus sp.]MCS6987176.1 acetyl-CoA carboxylase, carboxyltransferase subunit beta [Sphingomonadaceae bacterium]MDW8415790.1 acetyl-CoA carboxylase, carboxyltransferase subunit beta [Thermaurantiacus sp.]
MSWLTRGRARIQQILGRRELPDNLWTKCRGCGAMLYAKEFERDFSVCPECGFHERIGTEARFRLLFDDARWERVPVAYPPDDPLKFRDLKRYPERLKAARAATGEPDAMAVARGRIEGVPAVVAVQDFAFLGGSMGIAVGTAFITGARTAIADRSPYVVVTAAGGARMQEGILSLMQMPATTVAVQELREARLPYVVVLTDPTTGGVTASYAMLGDVHIAEPGALIGFAGARVIESTIREKLPEGFQRAEYLLEHGMIDMVVHRRQLKSTLGRVLRLLTRAPAA